MKPIYTVVKKSRKLSNSLKSNSVIKLTNEKFNKKMKSGSLPHSKISEAFTSKHDDNRSTERNSGESNYGCHDKSSTSEEDRSGKISSLKRNICLSEIEVDIAASEPPSKKKLRLIKKGKLTPSYKSSARDTNTNDQKIEKSESKTRSDYGIWIGNLPYHVSEDQIHSFLVDSSKIASHMITRIYLPESRRIKTSKIAGDEQSKKLFSNKGFAYIDFSCEEAVSQAIRLSEQLFNGRRLLIKDNKSFEGRPQKANYKIQRNCIAQGKKIFLGNLSFDTTEEILKKHFELCGPIKSLKMATFEDSGKCKGYAWIDFEEPQSAQNAVRGFIRFTKTIDRPNFEATYGETHDETYSSQTSSKNFHRNLWINKLNGRTLRVEFAEDAQIRYRKRYCKDRPKTPVDIIDSIQKTTADEKVKPFKKVEYRQHYAPRLTGGIIESKGKKITFQP